MSLVVVNVSAGSAVVTLPSISSVPGRILTVKDNGSASATNIATLTPTSGDTFESGVATYLLNTPFAYVTFIGNGATLKWRVLDSTYPDIPINIPPIIPSPGTLGGVTGTLTNLTVSGPTLLGNSSNTGNLGVAGTATISTLSVTGNAAFSKLQVQGGLSVFSSLNAYNINFTSSITSNGLPFSSGASASSGFAQITNLPLVDSYGICFDPSGNMYFADKTNSVIYKITPQGQTSVLAGTYRIIGNVDGTGSSALFNNIWSMIYDSYTGGLIVGTDGALRLVSLSGVVTTISGTANPFYTQPVDGSGNVAVFGSISGVCSDGSGNFYITELYAHTIRKVTIASRTPSVNSTSTTVLTVVGAYPTPAAGYLDGTGNAARLQYPYNLVINSSKNMLYVADSWNHAIRSVSLPGYVVTTIAGSYPTRTSGTTDSNTLLNSRFNDPVGIAIDANNNLFIADRINNRLRFINTTANYTLTLAGNGTGTNSSGVGTNGTMNNPRQVAFDNSGTLWIATSTSPAAIFNYNLQTGYLNLFYQATTSLLTPGNIQNTAVSTIVVPGMATGTILGSGFTTFNTVTYKYPSGIVMDSQNNLYVADSYKIRKVTPSGVVTSIYGDPSNLQFTMQQGTGATGQLNNIFQMSLDTSGNMYIVGISQNVIYKLNLTTYAGTAISITGQVLSTPVAVLYLNNKLYITNRGAGSYVVMVDLSTNVSTLIAGSTTVSGGVNNATGTSATFNTITGSCFDSTRTSMIVCDTSNNTLRTINLTSPYAVATLSFGGGLAAPVYVAIDSQYNLYVSNYATPLGLIKIPYTGSYTSPNQTYGTAIAFPTTGGINYVEPQGITIDSYNNIYITDSTNRTIYSITPSGITSVYSGQMGVQGTQDSRYASSLTVLAPYVGIGKTNPQYPLDIGVVTNFNSTVNFSTNAQITTTSGFAQISNFALRSSRGICFDGSGNLYVNDTNNYVIYKITPQGVTSLFAGTYGTPNTVDGYGSGACFGEIWQMSYDSYSGWIIVAAVPCIRAMNPTTAQVITLCGSTTTGNASGLGAAASFQQPYGVCSDGAGNIYVADNSTNSISRVSFTLPITAGGGTKTIIAGSTATPSGASGYYNNATGTSATFKGSRTIVINSSKTLLWVIDHTNNVIRQVSLTSPYAVTTYVGDVGSSATPGNTTSPAAGDVNSTNPSSVRFNAPHGIAIDASNNLFIVEYLGRRLKYINTNTFFTITLAGNGSDANVSGVGANAQLGGPASVALDPYGNPWISMYSVPGIMNYNNQTGYLNLFCSGLNITPRPGNVQNTAISTIVAPAIATGTIYGSGFTIANQTPTNSGGATYTFPIGLVMDSQNNLYVCDQYKIKKISPSGLVISVYGDPSNTQSTNFPGTGSLSQMARTFAMCLDTSGNMYIADNSYSVIYRLNLTTGVAIQLPIPANSNGTGCWVPYGMLYNNSTLYVANAGNNAASYIISINLSTNAVTLIAGQPGSTAGNVDNATGTSAKFNRLLGICFDANKSNIFAIDSNNTKIRVINLSGSYAVSTLASPISGTISITSAALYLTLDSLYNIYITQAGSPIVGIIKIPYTGTYPYTGLVSGSYGASSAFSTTVGGGNYGNPQGIAVDSYNNVYVADSTNKVVYYITPTGTGSVYSGVSGTTGSQDSTYASSISLMAPYVGINTANPTAGLSVNGNLYLGVPGGTGGFFEIYGPTPFNSVVGTRMFVNSGGTSALEYKFNNFYISDASGVGVHLDKGGQSWIAHSDEKLKENITPIINALNFCSSLRTVKYSLISQNLSTANKIGFIAQDFIDEHPEVSSTDINGNLGLAYTDTIPIAVAAIKELNIIVEGQASTITAVQADSSNSSTITGIQFSTLQADSSNASTITGQQVSTLQSDASNASTITGQQFSTLQSESLNQQSTIAGLQATITTILEKYPV